MDDQQVLNRIDELVQEEEALLHRHEGKGLSSEDHARMEELKVQLDKMWDYLRQRRALRQYGDDPDDAFRLVHPAAGHLAVLPTTGDAGTTPAPLGFSPVLGALAEWLRSGLQSRLHRFDSGRRLRLWQATPRSPKAPPEPSTQSPSRPSLGRAAWHASRGGSRQGL